MNSKFSLILATMGEEPLIKDLLESLKNQTYKNFEVIIVNQGDYDKLLNLVEIYMGGINIKYIHTSIKGLSRARNLGIAKASGNIFAFPDDDCEYKKDTLERVNNFFNNNDYNIYTFKVHSKTSGEESVTNWLKKSCEIDHNNVFRIGVSITTFIRTNTKSDIYFDELLGLGAKFGSGEETDLILSLLNKKYKGYYSYDQFIYHPQKLPNPSRIFNYALGTGALVKKEIINRKNFSFVLKGSSILIKPLLGVIYSIITIDTKQFYRFYNIFLGRIIGFYKYSSNI